MIPLSTGNDRRSHAANAPSSPLAAASSRTRVITIRLPTAFFAPAASRWQEISPQVNAVVITGRPTLKPHARAVGFSQEPSVIPDAVTRRLNDGTAEH